MGAEAVTRTYGDGAALAEPGYLSAPPAALT